MSTGEVVDLTEEHAPKEAAIAAFEEVLPSLKQELVKIRRDHDSKPKPPEVRCVPVSSHLLEHEPEYFRAVKDLDDDDLAGFGPSDLEAVRAGETAYGLHLFAKVKIPALDNGYIHVRIFVSAKDGTDGSDLDERKAKIHSIHTEEVVKDDGDRVYRAIFGKSDPLEWFET
jgi:hypothetical protein